MSRSTLPQPTPDTRSRDLIRNLFARLLGDAPSRSVQESTSADASHDSASDDSEGLFGDDPFGEDPFGEDPFGADAPSTDPLLSNADFGGDGYTSLPSGTAEDMLLDPFGEPSAEDRDAASIFGDDLFLLGDDVAGEEGSPTDGGYAGPASGAEDSFGISSAENLGGASIFGDDFGGDDALAEDDALAGGDGLAAYGFDSMSQDVLSEGDGLASSDAFGAGDSDSFHLSVVEENDSPTDNPALFGMLEAEPAAAEGGPAVPLMPAARCSLRYLPERPPLDTHRVVAVQSDELGLLNDKLGLGWRVIQMLGCVQTGDFVLALRYAGESA